MNTFDYIKFISFKNKIFNQKLNNQSRNFKHYANMSSNKFMVIVVSSITEEILVQLTDGWVEDSPIPEEGLYKFIQEIFGERIIKKYDELANMNLHENIHRIKQMMGVISEDYSKKSEGHQKLVDMVLDDLKYKCETLNSESDEIVSFDACELINSDLKVQVVDVKQYDNGKSILILLKYKNYRFIDEDSFVYELQDGLKKWIGNIKIEVEDSINIFPDKDRQW